MGRKPKATYEEKLQAVENYLSGLESMIQISQRLTVNVSAVKKWVTSYRVRGPESLMTSSRNKAYSAQLKQEAVQAYLSGQGGLDYICAIYEIESNSTLSSWIKLYNGNMDLKDYKPSSKGEIYMAKHRKYTIEEKIEVAKFCLDNHKDYVAAAEKYDVSYQNARAWTIKYIDEGEDGFIDRRGKKKEVTSLSEIEQLKKDNERLERLNKEKEMEITVLKKLQQIERGVLVRGKRK